MTTPTSGAVSPAWLRGAVTYGAVPTLFGDKPLEALTEKLDDLQALGVDAVWLSPIQETDDESQISYATTDFRAIRPDFGDDGDLKALVSEAHKRDIKILLDIAPNHVSSGHAYFQDAEEKGEASPYYSYFERDENGAPTNYFDWDHLKNLDFDSAGVKQMITEGFDHWVKEFDIDGFRVDAAWGPKDRNPEFWGELNSHLAQTKPGLFLLAEASARDEYYLANGFHAGYDWTEQFGEWSWSKVFDDDAHIGERLAGAIAASPKEGIAHFLNNNDTGPRFISTYGAEKTRVAATLLLTLPGLPVVYTGDEVGAEFQPYDDPPPISWSDPHGLKPHYTRLAELREELPSLAEGDFTPVGAEGAAYGFTRQAKGAAPVTVLLNFGKEPQEIDAPNGKFLDQLSGEIVEIEGGRLDLLASSSLVLTPAE